MGRPVHRAVQGRVRRLGAQAHQRLPGGVGHLGGGDRQALHNALGIALEDVRQTVHDLHQLRCDLLRRGVDVPLCKELVHLLLHGGVGGGAHVLHGLTGGGIRDLPRKDHGQDHHDQLREGPHHPAPPALAGEQDQHRQGSCVYYNR